MDRVVYPEGMFTSPVDVKKDVEFGLTEANNIRLTNSDGKILAELPVDDLISKEHNDSLDPLGYPLKSMETKPDMVNHPPHYNVNGFEVIDIIKAFTEGLNGIAAVDTGNAIKYILRWQHKNGVEDLKKARWYIDHLIKELEK